MFAIFSDHDHAPWTGKWRRAFVCPVRIISLRRQARHHSIRVNRASDIAGNFASGISVITIQPTPGCATVSGGRCSRGQSMGCVKRNSVASSAITVPSAACSAATRTETPRHRCRLALRYRCDLPAIHLACIRRAASCIRRRNPSSTPIKPSFSPSKGSMFSRYPARDTSEQSPASPRRLPRKPGERDSRRSCGAIEDTEFDAPVGRYDAALILWANAATSAGVTSNTVRRRSNRYAQL